MKKLIIKKVIVACIIGLKITVNSLSFAQKITESNPTIHGVFAYVGVDEPYFGWKAIESYKQHTCKYCHKTITTQEFLNPQGETVILFSSIVCPKNANGKHEFMTEKFNMDGSPQAKKDGTNNKNADNSSDKSTNEIINDKDLEKKLPEKKDSTSDDKTDPVIFNIDSLGIDKYITVFYSARNVSTPVPFHIAIKITSSDNAVSIPEEKHIIVVSPDLNFYVLKPLNNLNEVIKKGYNISITISDYNGEKIRGLVSQISGGKKGLFNVIF